MNTKKIENMVKLVVSWLVLIAFVVVVTGELWKAGMLADAGVYTAVMLLFMTPAFVIVPTAWLVENYCE